MAAKVTLGEEGFHSVALQVRDVMLSQQTADAASFARDAAGGLAVGGFSALRNLGQSVSTKLSANK